MHKILTPEKHLGLLSEHKIQRDKKIADRIKVILLFDKGWSAEKIAEALFIDDSSVRRHIHDYQKEERITLSCKGIDPILSESETAELKKHVEENCYTKAKDLQNYIFLTYQKKMALSTVTTWLKNNGFTYKKPKLVPKADPLLQEEFIEKYEKIVTKAVRDGVPVLFGDGVHPSQQTRPAHGWVKRGEDKIIEITSARKRLNILGALDLAVMKLHYQDCKTINGNSVIEFFKKLEAAYPIATRIDVILDNAGYNKSKEVTEFLEESRIKIHYLPPRSPNLNVIERLWKIMHEHVSNNRVYEKFKFFKEAIFEFFDNTMLNIPDVLKSRLTDKFRIVRS